MFYPVVRLYSLTLLYYTLAGVGVQSETQPSLLSLSTDFAILRQPWFSTDTFNYLALVREHRMSLIVHVGSIEIALIWKAK